MKISVIGPVKNESQFIGYSVMSALPFVHEFVYAVSPSDDGTMDILNHIKRKHGANITCIPFPDFDPHDIVGYNESFNICIRRSSGDACWFLHPDMIVTKWQEPRSNALAWTTNITSFSNDMNTVITKGRADQWKNIHANTFGLHYYGGYGSTNEDFYHRDITGTSYRHYGTEFSRYPFEVVTSGIRVNHYCELKPYKRRLEKMKLCLRTQHPDYDESRIDEMATHHPRVTLEDSSQQFGRFEFETTNISVPDVFTKYRAEFESLTKEQVLV